MSIDSEGASAWDEFIADEEEFSAMVQVATGITLTVSAALNEGKTVNDVVPAVGECLQHFAEEAFRLGYAAGATRPGGGS